MASFEIQRTQATPSGRAGAVPMNVNVDTGADAVGQAFAQLGNRIYELQANKQNAENAIKKSQLRLQYETETNNALQQLESTFDADEQNKIIGEYHAKISDLNTGIPDVDDDFSIHVNNTLAGNLSAFEKTIHHNQIRRLNDEYDINYQMSLETGNRSLAFDLTDNMVDVGAITPEKAEELKKGWFGDHILTKAMKYINTGNEKSLIEADKIITSMTSAASKEPEAFTSKQLGMLDDTKSAYAQADRRLRVAKQADMDAAEKNLVDRMNDNTLTLAIVKQYRNVFDAATYEKWTKVARNLDKPGNDIHLATLKEMSVDVWRGSRSKEDVKKSMLDSLSEPNGISTEQYAQISGFLDREVEKMQSEAVKRMSIDATRLILGEDSGAMTIDINGIVNFDPSKLGFNRQAQFERKMKYVDRCRDALIQAVADDPNISRRDLYSKMFGIKQQYIDAERADKMPEPSVPRNPNPDPINYPHAQYLEEYKGWFVPDPNDTEAWLEIR